MPLALSKMRIACYIITNIQNKKTSLKKFSDIICHTKAANLILVYN